MSTNDSRVREWRAFLRRRDPPRSRAAPLGDRIRHELEREGPLELGDLAARVDAHPARVERRCRGLSRAGEVRMLGAGRYDA